MKKNLKPMIISALTAVAMGSIGVGTTFALFTDKAETSISVGSGKVQVNTLASLSGVWEYDGLDESGEKSVTPTATNDYINSIGGRTKLAESGIFELSNWAPGDRARISVEATNLSNVKTKMRLKVAIRGELAGALTVKIYENGFNANPTMAAKGERTLVSEWSDALEAFVTPGNYGVEVHFENHGTEITSKDEGIDNAYQNKTANIIISYEAVQANANVSDSLLERANTILSTNAALGSRNNTMFDALADLEEAKVGMKASMLEAGYLWGVDEDLFYETSSITAGLEYRYFIPSNTLSATYSTYAYNWISADTVNLVGKSFDMGDVESTIIGTINYEGVENTARTNLIRGNTNVNININAPLDTVKHYGEALHVNITAVAGESYHEYGKAKFVEIANGRVALEKEAAVSQVHFAYDSTKKKFNNIVVAYEPTIILPRFSRDTVAIADIQQSPKLVVELQNSVVKKQAQSDFVWLYQEGLKEQMRVTETATPTTEELFEAPKSTDESVDNKTATAAEQIANNIAGDVTYEKLVDEGKVNGNGSIVAQEIQNTVVETGLDAEDKADIIDKYAKEDIDDCSLGHDNLITVNYYGTNVTVDSIYCKRCHKPVAFVDKLTENFEACNQIMDTSYSFKSFSNKNRTVNLSDGPINFNIFDLIYDNGDTESLFKKLINSTFEEAMGLVQENPVAAGLMMALAGVTMENNEITSYGVIPYLDWQCDFYVYFDEATRADSFYLGGYYKTYGYSVLIEPTSYLGQNYVLAKGESIPLMETGGFGSSDITKYRGILEIVKEFTCGFKNLSPENVGKTFTVELRVTNPEDETQSMTVTTTKYLIQ